MNLNLSWFYHLIIKVSILFLMKLSSYKLMVWLSVPDRYYIGQRTFSFKVTDLNIDQFINVGISKVSLLYVYHFNSPQDLCFQNYFNLCQVNIVWTIKNEKYNRMSYLHVKTFCEPGKFSTSLDLYQPLAGFTHILTVFQHVTT